MPIFRTKRVYEPPSPRDGLRILVDRLWPRGLRKSDASLDYWLKDVAPTTALRKWFGHKPERWPEFRKRYFAELRKNADALALLRAQGKRRRVTLLYSAHDTVHNQAIALAEYLNRRTSHK